MSERDETTPQEKFARLLALSAIQEARIKANPVPFLNKVAEENTRLRRAIDEAIYALSGAASLEIAEREFPKMPPSIVETCTIRNRQAAEILAAAIRP